MIKFNCIIHKQTGTVIKYEDWKGKLEKGHPIKCVNISRRNLWSYLPKDVLFNDDFEIIYDSEFTLDELKQIYSLYMESDNPCEYLGLRNKVLDIIDKIERCK